MVIKNLAPNEKEFVDARHIADMEAFKEQFKGQKDTSVAYKSGSTYVVFHKVNDEVLPIKLSNETCAAEDGSVNGRYTVQGFNSNGTYFNGAITTWGERGIEENPDITQCYSSSGVVINGNEVSYEHSAFAYDFVLTNDQNNIVIGPVHSAASILNDFNNALAHAEKIYDAQATQQPDEQ